MRSIDETDKPVANIPPFGLRLQPGLKRRVDEAARANGRSINAEIAARLEASFSSGTSGDDPLARRVSQLEQSFLVLLNNLGEVVERLDKAKL